MTIERALRTINRNIYWLASSVELKARKLWLKAPLINSPRASNSEYKTRFLEAMQYADTALASYLKKQHPSLTFDENWFRHLAYLTQTTIKSSPLSFGHGRLLFAELLERAKLLRGGSLKILEIGTARGFSAVCMAKALAEAKARGTIITIDPIPHNLPIYWNAPDDEKGKRTRAQLLKDFNALIEEYVIFLEGMSFQVLPRLGLDRIHFGFIDGAHEYHAVKEELSFFTDRQRLGDVIMLDDFNERDYPGVTRAVKEFCDINPYEIIIIGESDRRYVKLTRKKN